MLKCDIEKDQHSMIVNFDDLAAILLMPQSGIAGFSINPMSDISASERKWSRL